MTFVDANLFVYATVETVPLRSRARAALTRAADEELAISRQVLREYLAVMTRPQLWGRALDLAQAIADTEAFTKTFKILEDGPQVWNELIALSRRCRFAGKQVHDADIVATMPAHGERRILTFNDADFRRFAGIAARG